MNTNSTVAIISDIHIGVKKSSEKFLKTGLEYAEYLKNRLNENKVNKIFILGDVFNDRQNISLPALETATKFFDTLIDFDITIIIGNHDCFHEQDCEVSSVSIFSRWPNIKVVDKVYEGEIAGKTYVMVPWGCKLSDINKTYDVIFGHFDINTFVMVGSTVCENGINPDDVEKIAPKCFSGHFHLRNHRDRGNGKFISYVGSPYELNWGDSGQLPKAICYYDFETGVPVYEENTVSPRHIKIEISDILDNDNRKKIYDKSSGNIIKIVSEKTEIFKPEQISNAVDILGGTSAVEVQCEVRAKKEQSEISVTNEVSSLDPGQALDEYIKRIDSPLMEDVRAILKRMYTSVK